jgi:hypothetical protein
MVPALSDPPAGTISRSLGAFAILWAVVAAGVLLFPAPLADAFFAGWVVFSVAVAVVGGAAAWTGQRPLLWIAALALVGLSIAGMWSIGLFIAPAALSLLGAAIAAQTTGRREDRYNAILADPPNRQDVTRKVLLGASAVLVGGALVYDGAIRRELFDACARETVACALAAVYWDAAAITALGLLAVGLGGWLLWSQLYVARVLASRSA